MEAIDDDPRFAHIASDPRFKPMPKSKKKVKIDSRFQSLFTNHHFSHRMDMDKRGRPVRDSSKKNKHAMERFYEMSDSSSDAEDSESDESPSNPEPETSQPTVESEPVVRNGNVLTKIPGDRGKTKLKVKKKSVQNTGSVTMLDHDCSKEEKSKPQTKKKKMPMDTRKQKEEPLLLEVDAVLHSKKKPKRTDIEEQHHGISKATGDDADEDKAQDDEDDDDDDDSVKEEEDDDEGDEEEELPEYTADYDIEETEVDHRWNELQNDATEVSESTRRLAVCSMDWDFVKAQDLFVLFKSFVPEGGNIKSVAIYPSEFGKERMAEEAMLGPKEMRQQTESMENDDARRGKRKKGKKMDEKKEKQLRKERDVVHHEKLREYQLNRLKYYYAVVDCDSVRTADAVYSECDGREYQLSSVRLDLRFIPEDMTFDDEPREMFTGEQTTVDYHPSTFQSSALSQARVEVTWDETELDRLSRRVGTMQQKELEGIVEENKFADIIAPPESDSEEESDRPDWLKSVLAQSDEDDDDEGEEGKVVTEEEKIRLYRKVLMDKVAEEEGEKQKEEGDVDKVLEWQPGLKTSVEKKLKKKEKKKEESSLVSDYLEKKREKKRKKREKKMQEKVPEDGADAFSDDELPAEIDVDDSLREMMEGENANLVDSGKLKKKKKRKLEVVEENGSDEKDRAELELILMDDDVNVKHLSKPEVVDDSESKSKKKRKSKKQMAKLKKAGQREEEDFVLDVGDKRFGALFTSQHFHIDPTAPQFKKTKNMLRLVDEQIKRKSKKGGAKKRSADVMNSQRAEGEVSSSSKPVSQLFVESLKKKMKKT